MLERDPTKRLTADEFLALSRALEDAPLDPDVAPASTDTDPDVDLLSVAARRSIDEKSFSAVAHVATLDVPQDMASNPKYTSKLGQSAELSIDKRRHHSADYTSSARNAPPVTSSSTTMSAAGAVFSAAFGLFGLSSTPSKATQLAAGVSTPYKSRMQHVMDKASVPVGQSNLSCESSSSEDFVVIESSPARPWRADTVGMLSVRDLESPNVVTKDKLDPPAILKAAPHNADIPISSPPKEILKSDSTSSALLNAPNLRNEGGQSAILVSASSIGDMALSELHIATIISDCQYVCALVCAITHVGDSIVTKAGSGKVYSYRNATSLYLHALARLKDCILRVQSMRKSINDSHNSWGKLKALASGLSLRFNALVNRAEASQQQLTLQLQSQSEKKLDSSEVLPLPEPILYYAAIEFAQNASVNEMLGNLSLACSEYENARLLMESVLLTAHDASDKKVLKQYADTFAAQHESCKRSHELFNGVGTS